MAWLCAAVRAAGSVLRRWPRAYDPRGRLLLADGVAVVLGGDGQFGGWPPAAERAGCQLGLSAVAVVEERRLQRHRPGDGWRLLPASSGAASLVTTPGPSGLGARHQDDVPAGEQAAEEPYSAAWAKARRLRG